MLHELAEYFPFRIIMAVKKDHPATEFVRAWSFESIPLSAPNYGRLLCGEREFRLF